MADQPDLLVEARRARDEGIARAVAHAEATVGPEWAATAYTFLGVFARKNQTFTTEQVREAATRAGEVLEPPDRRAWGGVVKKAVRTGMLRRCGFVQATDPRVHMNIVALWQSLVYPGARAAEEGVKSP